MKEQDYELLSQYLDGELQAPQAQELRKRLLAEPQLRQAFDRLRQLDNTVKDAFSAPGMEDVPAQVTAMVAAAPARRRAPWGLAVAASLVAATGLILSSGGQQSEQQPFATGGDKELAQLLEITPSRADQWDVLSDGRQIRPLLSFQDKSGNWCREYLLSHAETTWRGVACRASGNWHTEVLASDESLVVGSEYRTASAADSNDVATYIGEHAADIALDLKQEAALISRHWQ